MVQLKTVEIEELIQCLANTKNNAHEKFNLLSEQFSHAPLKDARTLFFHELAEIVQSYHFAILFSKAFPNEELINRAAQDNQEEKSRICKLVWSSYLDEMKSALLVSFFVRFELCLRLIAQHFISTVTPQTNRFEKEVMKELLKLASVNDETLNLFQILIYTRNTIHYSGIRTRETHSVMYKGQEYRFKQGEAVDFLDFNGILFLINEAIDVMYNLMLKSSIKEEAFIEHPSARIFAKNAD